MSDRKYVIQNIYGEYFLAPTQGVTKEIDKAFRYDEREAKDIQKTQYAKLTIVPVESDAEIIAQLELEEDANERSYADAQREISFRHEYHEYHKRWLRAVEELGDLRRQNADLQAANNALLQRARDAEVQAHIWKGSETPTWFGALAYEIHRENEKWWTDPTTGERIERNKGEMIALMHSELSEMLEGVRKDLMDDHLPQYKSEVVELADLFIRALDYAGAYGLPLADAIFDKRAYNRVRKDHTHEARLAENGKKF